MCMQIMLIIPRIVNSHVMKLSIHLDYNTYAYVPDGVNSTRLKERLFPRLPDLKARYQGREVLLVFEQDIGEASLNNLHLRTTMTMKPGIWQVQSVFSGMRWWKRNKFDGSSNSE